MNTVKASGFCPLCASGVHEVAECPKRTYTENGPWRGPSEADWLLRISAPSTPAGESIPWIKLALDNSV